MENNKNQNLGKLTEIKAGKTGYGLLIESDGYVSRDLSENNKKIIKEAFNISDGEWNVPNPFVLDVILQKFNIENANKRIYPEHILKREVAKYQKLIDERMALGECYTPDTECLTKDGWKNIVDVKEGDEIITLNVNTNEIEYQKVSYKSEVDWDGELIHIESTSICDTITPNHSFPIYEVVEEKLKFKSFMTAEELSKTEKHSKLWLPLTQNVDDDAVILDMSCPTYSKIQYNGKVYCVEVPNHTWYVKQGDRCHWTKNCNHPAESTIDLGRISHNITECHWEGNTLVGKIEFNLTEGFRRHGICSSLGDTCVNLILNGYKIGVSSRGIGSVENRLGKTYVCDDYEIVCWDVVATPSTPGSYIGHKEDLQQYVESDETKKDKTQISEKINKIKNILL